MDEEVARICEGAVAWLEAQGGLFEVGVLMDVGACRSPMQKHKIIQPFLLIRIKYTHSHTQTYTPCMHQVTHGACPDLRDAVATFDVLRAHSFETT